MEEKIKFVNNEIIKTKAKLLDFKKGIEEEEKRLLSLYGALETLQIIEQEVIDKN